MKKPSSKNPKPTSPAGTGADAPVTDDPPASVNEGAAGIAAAPTAPASEAPASESVTLSFPLPDGIPAAALKAATLVVRAKSAAGRRRAGHSFSREETLLPFGELHDEQLTLLQGDDELVLSLRLARPG